jgi:hypothetical protein
MMHSVYFPAERFEENFSILKEMQAAGDSLKRAVIALREGRAANDHKFASLPVKDLWISDIGGRKGGRLIYLRKDGKLILWGLGPNHDIEEEAQRYFTNKQKEQQILAGELTDVTLHFLSEAEEAAAAAHSRIFAGNLSDDFLHTHFFLSDYEIGEIRKSNELSLWNLSISDAVKFKLYQYLKIPENTVLAARDELHLERFIQGSTEKLLIHLDPYQEKIVAEPVRKPMLIRGETGSGKTTILIYKAIYHAEANPVKSCILFTYNLSLANLIRDAVQELGSADLSNLQIVGFYEWVEIVMELLEKNLPLLEKSPGIKSEDLIAEAVKAVKTEKWDPENRAQMNFLKKEIEEIILAYGLNRVAKYLLHRRVGVERPLGKRQRQQIWEIYYAYRLLLNQKKVRTYGLLLSDFLKEAQKADFPFRQDAIFVDEVQDLPPLAIKTIAALRRKPQSPLVLAGDYKQAIYRRSFSWQDVKLPFHGANVLILKMNYRNTREILFAAHGMLKQFFPNAETPKHCGRQGRAIEFLEYESVEMLPKLKGIIRYLHLEEGIDYSDIAIFSPSGKIRELADKLQAEEIPAIYIKQDNLAEFGDAVRVSTLHSAKGLEFRAVIILDADKEILNFRCADEQLKLKIAARLLYVGMTRAYDALFFLLQKDFPQNPLMKALDKNPAIR